MTQYAKYLVINITLVLQLLGQISLDISEVIMSGRDNATNQMKDHQKKTRVRDCDSESFYPWPPLVRMVEAWPPTTELLWGTSWTVSVSALAVRCSSRIMSLLRRLLLLTGPYRELPSAPAPTLTPYSYSFSWPSTCFWPAILTGNVSQRELCTPRVPEPSVTSRSPTTSQSTARRQSSARSGCQGFPFSPKFTGWKANSNCCEILHSGRGEWVGGHRQVCLERSFGNTKISLRGSFGETNICLQGYLKRPFISMCILLDTVFRYCFHLTIFFPGILVALLSNSTLRRETGIWWATTLRSSS